MPKKQTKKLKEKPLPLWDELNKLDQGLLRNTNPWIHPEYLEKNMVHKFRHYQENALRYFHYALTDESFKNRNVDHVLFNMATGSGKTDLMAGLMLYLFQEHHYQNFLFIVNTDAVLKKTIDNLTNPESSKYLFAKQIVLDGNRVSIQRVTTFPTQPQENTIYLKLSSVQKLSKDISESRENAVGIKDFERNKTIILGDEAHHYNASTKSEKENENSWEYIIKKILAARGDNRLLEFTATMNFDNEKIYEKYKDKVIFRYALDQFIRQGFSKNVKRIQNANDDEDNMLNAILLNQFRKIHAREMLDVDLKPVILFKSSKIDTSLSMNEKFNQLIADLTVEKLLAFIKRQKIINELDDNVTLNYAWTYFENPENTQAELENLKHDFSRQNVLNANDTDRSRFLEKGQYELLNSLESPANPIRAIFAVAKLTEGWDVLNLYDIVRIKENAATNSKATDSEAQLIGRGARYNPFVYQDKQTMTRRFDNEVSDRSGLLLETLHYHTMNEPQYLKNLVKSLDAMDLPTDEDVKAPLLNVKVKESFKKSAAWNFGKIFYNETVKVPESAYTALPSYGIDNTRDIVVNYLSSGAEVGYRANEGIEVSERHQVKLNFDKRLIFKAMNRLNFYHFNELKKVLPNLLSRESFIFDENWLNLANRDFFVDIPKNVQSQDLSALEHLKIMELFLSDVEKRLRSGFVKEKGTDKFIGYPIKDYISDYRKRVKQSDSEVIYPKTYSQTEFVYETAIINATERQLVERLLDKVSELKTKYDEVYLIRMDENMHRESVKSEALKLHQFGEVDEVHLEGFQPDFILYLSNSEYMMQIFIEPKGADRAEAQQWKEAMLEYFNEHEVTFEDEIDGVKIRGVKFYLQGDPRNTLKEIANISLGKDDFDRGSIEKGNLLQTIEEIKPV